MEEKSFLMNSSRVYAPSNSLRNSVSGRPPHTRKSPRKLSPSLTHSPYLEKPKSLSLAQIRKTEYERSMPMYVQESPPELHLQNINHIPRKYSPTNRGEPYTARSTMFTRTEYVFRDDLKEKYTARHIRSPYYQDTIAIAKDANQKTMEMLRRRDFLDSQKRKRECKDYAEAVAEQKNHDLFYDDLIYAKNDRGIRMVPTDDRLKHVKV